MLRRAERQTQQLKIQVPHPTSLNGNANNKVMSIIPWSPFDSDVGDDFFDPFEGRKVTNTDAFFEDPFANRLPENGWCRVPCRFTPQLAKSKRRRKLQLVRQKARQEQAIRKEPHDAASFISYHSYDIEEGGGTEEESEPSIGIDREQTLGTIDEDAAVFAKYPSLKRVSSNEISTNASMDDFERIAQERAFRRVQRWLYETGLVDELAVDPKTLPQNRYSSEDSVTTTKSQEGVEVGRHGVTLEGDTKKIALQFSQFKVVTLREMDKIDDKLLQHQRTLPEIFKDDIKKYPPIVQSTVNARLNIGRVFAEVDYFKNILESCDRLATELAQAGDDWNQVKDIVDDHVTMQSLLAELVIQWLERPGDKQKTKAFLAPSIRAVRELGHLIRSKLLGGIGQAFGEGNVEDLKNLVDAMQLYEHELEELGGTKNEAEMKRARTIVVSGIRKIALERILEDCDSRGHELFHSFQEDAADDAASTTAEQASFDAVIQACETMMEAVDVVKEELIPLFPPSWNVFPIWAACVGCVCSQYLLQRIGGQEGKYLAHLTPNQLLKSMVWIESFREKVGMKGVNLVSDKQGFFTAQDLMTADMGQKTLARVVTVLWDIHSLVANQFLVATRVQTNQWLDSVCRQDHCKIQTTEGRLITSLPEDLWVLASAHLTTIRERFSHQSSVVFQASSIIFSCILAKERTVWRCRHEDMETCCAAANDALRMIELAEVALEDIKFQSDLTEQESGQLDALVEQLTTQFLQDAVYSAKSLHVYVFGPIEEALRGRIFEVEWEDLTENDMAVTIVRTLDDYLGDMEKWLEEPVLRKAVDCLVRGTVVYYVQGLLFKSIRRRKHVFENTPRALQRISGDIATLVDFFEGWVAKFPPLARVLESEFETLYAILELLQIGGGERVGRDATELFPFFLRKIGRLDCTKFLCCQLWHMLSVDGGRKMRDLFDATSHDINSSKEIATEAWESHLQFDNMILHVMDELRERIKVKSKVKSQVKNARHSLVVKAGNIKRRAAQVIDRVVDA